MSGKGRLVVRAATRDDIAAFANLPNTPSIRAYVGEIDGRLIGMGGFAFVKGRWFYFLDLAEDARPYKMHIMRAAIRLIAEARRDGIRFLYAEADPGEPRAVAWLTRLGFIIDPRSEHLYRWSSQDPWQN